MFHIIFNSSAPVFHRPLSAKACPSFSLFFRIDKTFKMRNLPSQLLCSNIEKADPHPHLVLCGGLFNQSFCLSGHLDMWFLIAQRERKNSYWTPLLLREWFHWRKSIIMIHLQTLSWVITFPGKIETESGLILVKASCNDTSVLSILECNRELVH